MAATLALGGNLPGLPKRQKRPMNKRPDGSWIMGVREQSRLEWRDNVNKAARNWSKLTASFRDRPGGRKQRWSGICRMIFRIMGCNGPCNDELGMLDIALAAPRKWRIKNMEETPRD